MTVLFHWFSFVADPPLFLKFINYLCNDAVHLLDEAMRMMKEIREKEQEKLKGEWQALTDKERQEKETQLQTVIKHSRWGWGSNSDDKRGRGC